MLRSIKTWLRSRMAQKRLNSLPILYDSKSILDNILLLHVRIEFVDRHPGRKNTFWQFFGERSVDLCTYFVFNLILFL